MNGYRSIAAALMAALLPAVAAAQESRPSPSPERPVTQARIGGGPAEAAFRDAIEKSGDDYRAARAECVKRAANDRSACLKTANAKLRETRAEAKATLEAARKARRKP